MRILRKHSCVITMVHGNLLTDEVLQLQVDIYCLKIPYRCKTAFS